MARLLDMSVKFLLRTFYTLDQKSVKKSSMYMGRAIVSSPIRVGGHCVVKIGKRPTILIRSGKVEQFVRNQCFLLYPALCSKEDS